MPVFSQESFSYEQSFKTYGQYEGLSSNECHHIFEDDRNYLWISTDEGLSRFDGTEFRHFGVNEGLQHPFVVQLKRMPSGRVFGWTFPGDIFQLKNDEIIPLKTDKSIFFRKKSSNLIIDIIESKDSTLYIATNEARGYATIDLQAKVSHFDTLDSDLVVLNYTKVEDQLFLYLSNQPGKNEEIILKSPTNQVPIPRVIFNNFKSKPIRHHGKMYHCTFDRLIRFDGESIQVEKIKVAPWSINIVDDKIWLSSRKKAVYPYDVHTLKPSGKAILKDDLISSFYKDQGGVYWLTSLKKGLIRYRDFTPFTLRHPLVEKLNFKAIASNQMDNLKFMARETNQYHSNLFNLILPNRSIDQVDSRLLSHLDIKYDKQLKRYYYSKANKDSINYFSVDAQLKLRNITEENYQINGFNLKNRDIMNYNIAVEIGDSLIIENGGEVLVLTAFDSIMLSQKYTALQTDIRAIDHYRDIILFGTKSKGLLYLRNNQIFKLDESDGLLSNHITTIEVIDDGKIILATNKGLVCISIDENRNLKIQSTINQNSGLKEIDIESMAYTKDTLWILSNRFIQGIPFELFREDAVGLQKMIISDLRVNNEALDIQQVMKLASNTTKLSFQIRKIDFSNLKQQRVYVKLEGYDEAWQETEIGYFQYSNLSPGKYSLKAAVDLDQIHTSDVRMFQFIIDTPIYKEVWFVLLLAILLLGLVFLLLRFYKQRIRLKDERLDHLKRLKMKAMMAQINPHFTFNVLNSIQGLILQNDKMEAVDKLSDFSDLVRKLLEVTDKTFVSIREDLDILKMYIDFEQLRMNNAFSYSIEADESILESPIPPLIFQPLVENAIWHGIRRLQSRKGHILIKIQDYNDRILFSVEDNGELHEDNPTLKKTKKKRNSKGIDLVKERIKLINEKYSYSNTFLMKKSKNGTIVSFYIMKTN